jgi:hypothetical protein
MFPQPIMLLPPDGIRAVRLECNACRSAVSLNLQKANESPPTSCPGCGELWMAGTPDASEVLRSLSLGLRKWAASEKLKFPFAVRLEVSPMMHAVPDQKARE